MMAGHYHMNNTHSMHHNMNNTNMNHTNHIPHDIVENHGTESVLLLELHSPDSADLPPPPSPCYTVEILQRYVHILGGIYM